MEDGTGNEQTGGCRNLFYDQESQIFEIVFVPLQGKQEYKPADF